MSTVVDIKKSNTNFKIDPVQFTVLIFLVSIVMLFAGFTSAYMVRKAEGNWVEFELPSVFVVSCVLVIASSIFLTFGQLTFKNQKYQLTRLFVGLSIITGIGFLFSQFEGWTNLTDQGIYLVGNPSGSFLFIISGIHALHVVGGVLMLLISFIRTLLLPNNEMSTIKLHTAAIYWHFVGVLWIYLFLFFKYV